MQFANGQRRQEVETTFGRDNEKPMGIAPVGGAWRATYYRRLLPKRSASFPDECGPVSRGRFRPPGYHRRWQQGRPERHHPATVAPRAVVTAQDSHNLTGGLSIGFHAGTDKDCLRAEGAGPCHRHGRVDPKTSGFVATGGNDSPAIWITADDQRLTAELRPVALFYGRKEGIHVHMDDLAEFGTVL